MTTAKKLISAAGTAAGGAAGGGTYVDDVFSTYVYEGTGGSTTATSTSTALSGSNHTHNIQFSSDGLYLATHLPNSDVYIWSLSTPYDASTITSSTNFSYTSQTTNSQASRLSDDGTKAYVADGTTDVIFQYDLSTAYDASSASYASKSLDISGQVTNPRGFFFKPDGTSLFVVCANNDAIYQYTLSTAWDISSGSYASKSVSTGGETNPYNVFFNDTGTVMIICGSANGLTEFALSTAWDVSTASATGTTGNPDTYGTTTLTFAADFADSGTRLVVMDSDVKVGVGDLPGSYDIDTIGDGQAIRNGIDLASEGGAVWIKQRDANDNNYLFDTERGTTYSIFPNSNYGPHVSYSGGLTSFNSNGFGVGSQSGVNTNGGKNVAWTFRKAPGFFDVVTYTGDGTSGRQIAHSLGSTPGMMMVKATSDYSGWAVYHRSLGATKAVLLDTADTPYTSSSYWNDTAPTDSVFTLGSGWNVNGVEFVAYIFAHDAQDFGTNSDEAIIKCGSYTGNGSDNGPTVDLGFEPQWIILKDTTSAYNWYMFDTMRGWNVVNASELRLTLSAENSYLGGAYDYLKPLPNGFQITDAFSNLNTNGNEYIYMAIRRPHKPASEFSATDLFAIDFAESSGIFTGEAGFPVDFVIYTSSGHANYAYSRLTGAGYLVTSTSDVETGSGGLWDSMTNFRFNGSGDYSAWINWLFRRAPGFFDVVAYVGDGNTYRSVNHNLGVTPELIICRCRNFGASWAVYYKDATEYSNGDVGGVLLNNSGGEVPAYQLFDGHAAQTSTQFVTGSSNINIVNRASANHIAYLFATAAGISKVGTYTGTGSDVNVDCGFSNGARFVLAKRTDSTGDWYLWDSERGIVAGNDPYLLLNSAAAHVTSTDYIDPLSSGFTITSSAPAALNASGGTYLFLAIA